MKKEYKNKRIDLRLTENEYKLLKQKSTNYPTMTSYILDACMKFDDALGIKRLSVLRDWCNDYKKYEAELNKIGINLNQISHYLNKLSMTGVISQDFLPVLKEQYSELINLLCSMSESNLNYKKTATNFLTK